MLTVGKSEKILTGRPSNKRKNCISSLRRTSDKRRKKVIWVLIVGVWSPHPKHFGAHRGAEQSWADRPIDLIPLWWPQVTGPVTLTEEDDRRSSWHQGNDQCFAAEDGRWADRPTGTPYGTRTKPGARRRRKGRRSSWHQGDDQRFAVEDGR